MDRVTFLQARDKVLHSIDGTFEREQGLRQLNTLVNEGIDPHEAAITVIYLAELEHELYLAANIKE